MNVVNPSRLGDGGELECMGYIGLQRAAFVDKTEKEREYHHSIIC